MNLYDAFYTGSKREERSSLEVFLTRTLVDLLNRLSNLEPGLTKKLIMDLFLGASARATGKASEAALNALKNQLQGRDGLMWSTEESIHLEAETSRRADISIKSGHKVLSVVEAKVFAPLSENQLSNYGKWLKSRNSSGALVFLTHATPAPLDFLSQNSTAKYGVPLRAVCSWMDLYEWSGWKKVKDPFLSRLLGEFRDFMKQENLNGITKEEVSFIREVLEKGVGDKIGPFFVTLRRQLQPRMQKLKYDFNKVDPWNSTQGHAVWDWCYYKKNQLGWYVAWGVANPQFFSLSTKPTMEAFVVVGAEDHNGKGEKSTSIPLKRLSGSFQAKLRRSGWVISGEDNECLKKHNATKLANAAGGFTQAFINWLDQPLKDAHSILTECYAKLPG